MPTRKRSSVKQCPIPQEDLQRLSGAKVIVSDDSLTFRRIQKSVFKGVSELVCVDTGSKAVIEARKKQFDFAILDVWSPHLDGPQAAREIRSMGQNMPIIFISSDPHCAMERVVEENAPACFLLKPITKDVFLRTLTSFLPISNVPTQEYPLI